MPALMKKPITTRFADICFRVPIAVNLRMSTRTRYNQRKGTCKKLMSFLVASPRPRPYIICLVEFSFTFPNIPDPERHEFVNKNISIVKGPGKDSLFQQGIQGCLNG